MARFRIEPGGVIYRIEDVQDVSLKHHLLLERQTEDLLGDPVDMEAMQKIGQEIEALPPAERSSHPKFKLYLAVLIWAGRVVAGENITFEQAIDFPVRAFEWVPEPRDRQPKKTTDPTRARPAGGRAKAGAARPRSR